MLNYLEQTSFLTLFFLVLRQLSVTQDNLLDYKATKEKVVSNSISDYFDTTPLLLQFIHQSNRSRTLF